ncbi:MAG: radical SAM protein [Candidatus Lernaella stagnicola]|nr:radical SAM protein [Candidatus Lernaella stagnicola]
MNRKILLLQPPGFGLEKGKGKPSLPLALVYVAALVPDDIKVEIVDLRLTRLTGDLLQRWRDPEILAVGLTAITGLQAKTASETAAVLRKAEIGPIVWGGKHATLFGETLVRDGLADYAIIGDGEDAFAQLAAALRDADSVQNVPGVWHRDASGVSRTGEPAPFELERIERLPFTLLRHDYLYRKQNKWVGVLETSRGCPGRCTYCYLSTRTKPFWRGAPADWVMRAIDDLTRTFPRAGHIDFVDDNFFADRERALQIARLMPRRHPGLTWTSNGGRLRDLAAMENSELAQLAAGGLDRVDIGVETGSPRIAEMLHKSEEPGLVHAQVKRLLAAGIRPWINLMIGFPDEDEADRGQTLDLALDLTKAGALVSPIYAYTPYPGTTLAQDLAARGYAIPTAADLADASWNYSRAPWVSPELAAQLGVIYTASLFIDDKLTTYRPGPLASLLLKVLRPLSRRRLRRRRFGRPWERRLLRFFFGEHV